jgi:hypothetical protein
MEIICRACLQNIEQRANKEATRFQGKAAMNAKTESERGRAENACKN